MLRNGYQHTYLPNHPLAHCDGYVPVHRLVADKHHGPLAKTDHVHHLDGDRLNNAPSNLMIYKSNADHQRLGHPNRQTTLFPKKRPFKRREGFSIDKVVTPSY